MTLPTRILSVGHSYVVALNRAILRELAKDPNFEVTIGAPKSFQGSLRSIEIEPEPPGSNIKLVPLSVYGTRRMHTFGYNPLELYRLYSKGFDLAHFWEEPYILSGFQLTQMARFKKVPYLFRTAQSLIKNYVPPFGLFEKASLKGARAWVAGGELVYKAMREKGWSTPGQVLTLAVDTNCFQVFSEQQKREKKAELGLKSPLIGYLGRLSEEKGLDLIMEVLTQLKEKPWSFLAMGSGPYKEKLEAWARDQGFAERVKVTLLAHDEVPQVLPACDLLIAPSQTRSFWKEQFGRMLVEAFASGVPVIGSDSGEIPRVIGEAGVVLGEQDRGAWTATLSEFLDSPTTFDRYIPLGLKRAETFSAKSLAEQYKNFYHTVLSSEF